MSTMPSRSDAELELAIRRIVDSVRRMDRRFVIELSNVLHEQAEQPVYRLPQSWRILYPARK